MDQEQKARSLVRHLKAAGEKFDDEEYVIHEITQLGIEAFRAGAASVGCGPLPATNSPTT